MPSWSHEYGGTAGAGIKEEGNGMSEICPSSWHTSLQGSKGFSDSKVSALHKGEGWVSSGSKTKSSQKPQQKPNACPCGRGGICGFIQHLWLELSTLGAQAGHVSSASGVRPQEQGLEKGSLVSTVQIILLFSAFPSLFPAVFWKAAVPREERCHSLTSLGFWF